MSIAIKHREPNGRLKRASSAADKSRRAVYVMSAGFGACVKIGTSRNPASRAASINSGNAVEVTISAVVWLVRDEANRLERAFHRKFSGTARHIRGEWYSMKPGEAYAELWEVAEKAGIKIRLEKLESAYSAENRGFHSFRSGKAEAHIDSASELGMFAPKQVKW